MKPSNEQADPDGAPMSEQRRGACINRMHNAPHIQMPQCVGWRPIAQSATESPRPVAAEKPVTGLTKLEVAVIALGAIALAGETTREGQPLAKCAKKALDDLVAMPDATSAPRPDLEGLRDEIEKEIFPWLQHSDEVHKAAEALIQRLRKFGYR